VTLRLPLSVDVDPVVLPGAPATDAAAARARSIIERLEDVRITAVMLAGAAEQVDLTIDASPHVASAPILPTRAWAKSALAAVQLLRAIIEACAAFEDAIAGAGASPAAPGNTSPDRGPGIGSM
jgi:beta-phosphoglucomutase-like phosphatase (HAD superfamily)